MKKNIYITLFLCLAAMFFLSPQSHALMVDLNIEKLTKASEVVVLGKVVKTKSYWGEGEIIFTKAFIRVQNVIRGKVATKKIVIEYEGGEIGDIGFWAGDAPTIKRGEKVILFLVPKEMENGIKNMYEIVGGAQGKYTIGTDGIARRYGFCAVNKEDIVDDNNISVSELINKIKEAK